MSRYIHRRNIRYRNRIALHNRDKLLGVAVDPSKEFHRIILFNFRGKQIGSPFSINVLRSGYEELKKRVTRAATRIGANEVYFAIELAATYSDNLVYNLRKDYKNVLLINPVAVAKNREQKSLHGLKTDDIDAGSIADLLIRGEYVKSTEDSHLYIRLKNLINWREKRVFLRSALKNQLTDRLRKIFPGLNNSYGDLEKVYEKSFQNFLHIGLLESCMTGQEILKVPNDVLADRFGYTPNTPGKSQIEKLKNRMREMMLPSERLAKYDIELLKLDLWLFKRIGDQVDEVEAEIITLAKKTPAKYIMGQIKGINDLLASLYIGLVGDIRNYRTAGHIYSKSGLSPKTRQSGSLKATSLGIKKAGNRHLRSVMFRMACQVIVCDPFFKNYYKKIKANTKKHWKELRIIVCRKLNRMMFAMMRDKTNYRFQATANSS